MIASRRVENLQSATEELKRIIDPSSTADVSFVQCNIRKEEEVFLIMFLHV